MTAACSKAPSDGPAPAPGASTSPSVSAAGGDRPSVLLAYFSRPGENYYYGGRTDLKVGNTEVLAGLISRHIDCDVHRIQPAEPYSDDYDQTVARNVREQQSDVRPAIADPLKSIAAYDIVLLGSPIWNVRPPMIMQTFSEAYDFAGKRVYPFTTYAVSGLGEAIRDYTAACSGASIGDGLAVQGEKVRDADPQISSWVSALTN